MFEVTERRDENAVFFGYLNQVPAFFSLNAFAVNGDIYMVIHVKKFKFQIPNSKSLA